MPRKTITFHYRRVDHGGGAEPNNDLETNLRAVFRRRVGDHEIGRRWHLRAMPAGVDERGTLATNHLQQRQTHIFGEMLAFTSERAQAYVQGNTDAEILDIGQLEPGEDQSFVEGMLYWFVRGDHVLFASVDRLAPSELERYLRWLLSTRTNVWPGGAQLVLYDGIDRRPDLLDTNESIKSVKLDGLTMGRPIRHDDAPQAAGEQRRVHRGVAARRAVGEWALNVLRAVVGNNDHALDEIRRAVPEGAQLQVDVRVGFEAYSRVDQREALRQLAIATRGLDDANLVFETKSGTTVAPDKIRISRRRSVRAIDSIPDPNAVEEEMITIFTELARERVIE